VITRAMHGIRGNRAYNALLGSRRCPALRGAAGTHAAAPRGTAASHCSMAARHGLRRYLPKPSNSPFLTPPRKACHSSGVNIRTGPAEFLLLRTPTSPPGRLATSTQLPLA